MNCTTQVLKSMQYMSLWLPKWKAVKLPITSSLPKQQNLSGMQVRAALARMVKAEAKHGNTAFL